METATTSAPTAPVEPTTPAPPATVETPTQTPAVSDRPKSFKDAFARLDAAEAVKKPSTEMPATTAPAATAQPGVPVKPAATAAPIPLDVHQKALENARTKAVTEYRQKYGWAEGIPQETFQQVSQGLQAYATDPIAFIQARIAEVASHPVWGPKWQASQPNGPARPSISLDPDVEIMGPDGRPVGATYSAERVKAIVDQAVQKAIGQEVQPLKTAYEQRQAEERRQAQARLEVEHKQQAEAQADKTFTQIKRILDITEDTDPLLNDVMAVWTEHPDWSVHDVAIEVRDTKVKPRLQGQAVQAAETEMRRKAAANTVNGTGTTAMPKRPQTRAELAAYLRALDEGGASA